MMPSAKMLSRSRAPPENTSKNSRIVPSWERKKAARAVLSTPGVGMWAPIRNTTSISNVKTMRLRSSSILKAFWNVLSMASFPPAGSLRRFDDDGLAARRLDLLLGGLAELVRLDRHGPRELAVAEHLDRQRHVADQSRFRQFGRADGGLAGEGGPLAEIAHVDDVEAGLEDVVEAAPGEAPVEGRLPALEVPVHLAAGVLALLAARGRLAAAA